MAMTGEDVVILTASTATDEYGNTIEDWDNPTETTVTTIAPLEPRPVGEAFIDSRNAVTSGWTLYLPAGTEVAPRDRVRVRGEEYPVQGQPADWGDAGVVVQAFGTVG
jgi:hypothetical protein